LEQGNESNPGAGMTPKEYKPFATVLKDGFFEVDCTKDLLFNEGDKFGDGKFSYRLGDVSNVSIVHYTELIPKEDREQMTHEVCFGFCRTIPEMHFFGMVNGYDCYCAPYYKPMAGDSSECDAVCPGHNTQFCGGKHKSSVFEMHECKDTMQNLYDSCPKAKAMQDPVTAAAELVKDFGDKMQATGVFWQDVTGALGQPAPSDLMQDSKVFAGELIHSTEGATKLTAAMDALSVECNNLIATSKYPLGFEKATQIEAAVRKVTELQTKADEMVEDLQDLAQLASPTFPDDSQAGTSKEYYPLTYFVDKEINSLFSTCGGTKLKKPMINVTLDTCAKACDAVVGECVGFSYFNMGDQPPMCFLFAKFKTLSYVIDCPKFLQTSETGASVKADSNIGCYGKLSEFPSNISPQASGKCDGCLREANKFCSKQ